MSVADARQSRTGAREIPDAARMSAADGLVSWTDGRGFHADTFAMLTGMRADALATVACAFATCGRVGDTVAGAHGAGAANAGTLAHTVRIVAGTAGTAAEGADTAAAVIGTLAAVELSGANLKCHAACDDNFDGFAAKEPCMIIHRSRGISQRKLLGLPRRLPTRRFIPDGDFEFASTARNFAQQIKEHPARYHVSAEDAERVDQAVQAFRDALAKSSHRFTRNARSTMIKNEAREEAEALVRKFGNLIRLDDQISPADKIVVGVRERSKPVRRQKRLLMAPELRFVGATNHLGMCGHMHILKFCDRSDGVYRSKPQGAVRLELFVELVDPTEPNPAHPAELSGGRLWYLQSYTRSPIHVEFPVANQPMRVVYWARWADSRGNVGPFCRTVVARVEGWDGGGRALPNFMDARQRQQKIVITSAMKELPDYAAHGEEIRAEVAGLLPDREE